MFYRGLRLVLLLAAAATTAFGIVRPKVSGLTLPAGVLERLAENPQYYLPERALTRRMMAYREEQSALSKGGRAAAPVVVALLVLCMQYADADSQWAIAEMASQLFDTDSPWPTGSMATYYREVSYGQLEITGDVIGWIKMSGTTDDYKRYPDDSYGPETYNLITEALSISDDTVNYGRFDSDGPDGIPNSGDDDGYVDQLVLIHSGKGGEYGTSYIWSHSWSLNHLGGASYTTNDTSANGEGVLIKVDEYVIQPEMASGGKMEAIGVFCHEFGHALGLPDLYDRDESSEGIGNWGLMAGAGSESTRPSHMSAWSKEVLGWITPVVVQGNLYDHPIPAVVDSPVVYKLWTHGAIQPYSYTRGGLSASVGLEYFLVENRRKKGFDDHLPGEGLLIWHIRNDVKTQNDDEYNKLVDLEEADNLNDLDHGRDRGDAGDAYPGAAGNRDFSRQSSPGSQTRAGGVSKVGVGSISDPGDTMYADLEIIARDLVYDGYVLDDATGNANGFADPGETVALALRLHNFGADIPSFTYRLYSSDSSVTIHDDRAVLADIPEDGTVTGYDDTFGFSVNPAASYHPLIFSVVGKDGAGHREVYRMLVMMENQYVLLVDDTGNEADETGQPLIRYYQRALEAASVTYYSDWPVLSKGVPTAATLDSFRTVVWVTGSRAETLDQDEQAALKAYLDQGGSLFISGQNIGYDLDSLGTSEDAAFYADYLKAGYVHDSPATYLGESSYTNILMSGVAEDPITWKYAYPHYFYLSGGNSANNQHSPDVLVPLGGAAPMMGFFGTGLSDFSSHIPYVFSGISYAGGPYRLIYLSFGLEGINETGSEVITRAYLMQRSIGWLQEDERLLDVQLTAGSRALPARFTLAQNYPNPFNASTTITYALHVEGAVQLVIYDLGGRLVRRLVHERQAPGAYACRWLGRDDHGRSLPSGVYFYQLRFGGSVLTRKLVLLK